MKHTHLTTLFFGTIAPVLALAQSASFTPGIPDGSYKGKFRGGDHGAVQMMTKKIKGCEGCFIAVIFKRQRQFLGPKDFEAQAYKALPQNDQAVDGPRTSTQYTLTPIGVDPEDGELTTPNDNPSLVLNITRKATSPEVEFTIANAQSNNHVAFDATMLFKGKESRFDLSNGEEGRYKRSWACREEGTISLFGSNLEDDSRSATVTWNGNETESGGTFTLREKAPGVFTFNAVSYLATGPEAQNVPKKVVVFIKQGDRERALLIDPNNSRSVAELKIMRRN